MHENLGISMFEYKLCPDAVNPESTYEDVVFWSTYKILFQQKTCYPWQFENYIVEYIKHRQSKDIYWGFKHNRNIQAVTFLDTLFNNPHYIYVTRDKDLVINSMMQKWNLNDSKKFYEKMTHLAETFLKKRDYLQIHFDKYQKEDNEIENLILNKWEFLIA